MFISKRKNGYYYLFINDNTTGKRKMVSCKTKRKSESLKFLSGYDSETTYKPNYTYNVTDLQGEVLTYVKNNLRFTTYQIYRRVFKDLIRITGNKLISLITIRDIENYKALRLEEVTSSTVNIDLTTLKAIFNIAIRFNWIANNPVNNIKKLKTPEKEILSFTGEQMTLITNNIENVDLKNIVLFGLITACRLNEILNIEWSDIDFKSGIITIKNKEDFKTKSGKIRQIPVSDSLLELLESLRNKTGNIYEINEANSYLFNKKGFRYDKNYISKSFKTILRSLNLPERYHFHCLRHTAITNLIKAGVNINYVKAIAGHSDIKTTEHYIHFNNSDLKEAMNKIKF